jgi:hypothetical protein
MTRSLWACSCRMTECGLCSKITNNRIGNLKKCISKEDQISTKLKTQKYPQNTDGQKNAARSNRGVREIAVKFKKGKLFKGKETCTSCS